MNQPFVRITLFALPLAFALCLGTQLNAQGAFWNSRDAYLGQPRPSDTPQPFAPGLLADPGTFIMGRVAFSSDGKEFYFTQNDSWESAKDAKLKTIRYADHQWSKPAIVAEEFISPTLALDGKALFMRHGNMTNVWKANRWGDGWSTPEAFIDRKIGVYDYMPTLSGNAYVGSEPSPEDVKNGITYAFSVLSMNGNDIAIKSLGQPINEPGFNGDLYIAPDESYMIVSADETKTYESELFISFRKADKTWTKPVSLGPRINDGLAHRWGQYVSPDGKYLFYSHGTSEKDCAIYWVRFDRLLKSLRPR